jgi:hypothetical protein
VERKSLYKRTVMQFEFHTAGRGDYKDKAFPDLTLRILIDSYRPIEGNCCFYHEGRILLTSVPTFQDNLSIPSSRVRKSFEVKKFLDFLAFEDGTDRLSRNVGKELPIMDA